MYMICMYIYIYMYIYYHYCYHYQYFGRRRQDCAPHLKQACPVRVSMQFTWPCTRKAETHGRSTIKQMFHLVTSLKANQPLLQ